MKIALVSEHASPLAAIGGVDAGGQNVYVAELALALAARGHAVSVYTRRESRAVASVVAMAERVDVIHVDAGPPEIVPKDLLLPFMDAFGAELSRRWVDDAPDVVHSHFWMSGIAARIAARGRDIPWAHTYHALGAEKRRHQGAEDSSPFSRIALEREILREADLVIATSAAEMNEHRRTARTGAIRLIPCGVVVDTFAREERSQGRLGRVVTLSRLVPRKGVADVIRAVSGVPDAELCIGGGTGGDADAHDPEVARLRRIAEACRVGDRVVFAGPIARAAVPDFLRSAEIVVCAPLYEPFGLVPLEAMACGRPVVVTNVGGLVDTVVDEVTGLHVPPADPSALASAIRRLLGDESLRRRLGDAGRRRVEAEYTWAHIAGSMEAAYAEIAAGRGRERKTSA